MVVSLAIGCDRPTARAEQVAAEGASAAKPAPTVKSCMSKADRVCSEYERPELATKDCSGDLLSGPCPSDGRVGSCTTLVTIGGSATTVQRVHYAGGSGDPEAQCKLASGTWRR